MKLKVNEIFYSLQGEGGRMGEASIFIRLSGCNLNCSFCDTDFLEGENMSPEEILSSIQAYPSEWIIWTGGEPALQLSSEVVAFFGRSGYRQAIESNGTKSLPYGLDYTVCSPKGEDITYARQRNPVVDEIRLPLSFGEKLPPMDILPSAEHYFVSPVMTNDREESRKNIRYCVGLVLENPRWSLSVQLHKLIGIQ